MRLGRSRVARLVIVAGGPADVPQATEPDDGTSGDDPACHQQGDFEALAEGDDRGLEGMPACVRGCGMDLATSDISSGPGRTPQLGRLERGDLAVPPGQRHGGADGPEDGQAYCGTDLAAGVEQAGRDS
jgi:hypothetical protein